MGLIAKEKIKLIAFTKCKEGLIRKIHEFTTLCDVSACMIIYGPKQEPGSEASMRFGGAVTADGGIEGLLLLNAANAAGDSGFGFEGEDAAGVKVVEAERAARLETSSALGSSKKKFSWKIGEKGNDA